MKSQLIEKCKWIRQAIATLNGDMILNYTHTIELNFDWAPKAINLLEIDDRQTYEKLGEPRQILLLRIQTQIAKIEADVNSAALDDLTTLKQCDAKASVLFNAAVSLVTLDDSHFNLSKTENPLYNSNRNMFSVLFLNVPGTVLVTNDVETFLASYKADKQPALAPSL